MRSLPLAALAALAALMLAPVAPRAGVAEDFGLSPDEAASCSAEVTVIENRRRIYERNGLSPEEQQRRNRRPEAALAACRRRQAEAARAAAEDRAVAEEVARRLPQGTEVERERLARELRIERAGAQRRAPGAGERAAAAPAREPGASYRRPALSALLCVHERQLERAHRDRDAETHVGDGEDGRRAYFWRSQIHRLEENLAAERGAVAAWGGRLPCQDRQVARLTRCLALLPSEQEHDPACGGPDLEPFLRAAR